MNFHAQEEITQLKLILKQESRNKDYWYHRCLKTEEALQEFKKRLTGLLMEMEALDVFEQERTYVKELPEGCAQCDQCGEIVKETEMNYLDGTNVCRDCLSEFCSGYVEELGEAYIAAHRKEFYLIWWFENLYEEDRIKIAEYAYQKKKEAERQLSYSDWLKYANGNEKDFCLQSSDWIDFVKERAS